VPASVRNYLFKSLRNILFSKLTGRKEIVAPQEEGDEMDFQLVLSPEMGIIQAYDLAERDRQLGKALEGLTQRQKEALFLKFYEGLSYEEIALIMSITVKGTYKLVARALEVLRNSLTKLSLLISFSWFGYLLHFTLN
jgi:RNA polymerase sigma factor (sigma-70 family)